MEKLQKIAIYTKTKCTMLILHCVRKKVTPRQCTTEMSNLN